MPSSTTHSTFSGILSLARPSGSSDQMRRRNGAAQPPPHEAEPRCTPSRSKRLNLTMPRGPINVACDGHAQRMFLRCKVRRKDGEQHRYWSVVENTRVAGGRVVQRHVLYLGEINDTQELPWRRSIAVLEDGAG